MTLPASGQISMIDINSELDLLNPAINIDLKADLYNVANTGGGTGLMYHNLNMASNNTTSAKVAIFDPLNANANMSMSNWYNYTRDIDMVTTYTVTNNSANNLDLNVIIVDSSNNNVASVFNGRLNGGGGTSTGTASGPKTITGNISSGYRIRIENVDFQPPPNPPMPPFTPGQSFSVSFTITSSDTDGVGASTTRTVTTPGTYTVVGGTPNSFTAINIVDTSGSPIPCNKRTTVTITLA